MVVAFAAKRIIKGAMQSLSHQWTIEWFREQAAKDGDISDLVDAPWWYDKLLEMLEANPRLRETKLSEVIDWIKEKEGNPALVEELGPDPEVMSWLARAWKKFLAGEHGQGSS